jgi:hypothetical protein
MDDIQKSIKEKCEEFLELDSKVKSLLAQHGTMLWLWDRQNKRQIKYLILFVALWMISLWSSHFFNVSDYWIWMQTTFMLTGCLVGGHRLGKIHKEV